MPRRVMLVGQEIPEGRQQEIARGDYPRTDYYEIASRLGARIHDHTLLKGKGGMTGLVRKVMGDDAAMAWIGFKMRGEVDTYFTTGEDIGIPLAFLLKFCRQKKTHVMIAHVLSPLKKRIFFYLFGVTKKIDRFIVYATIQVNYLKEKLRIPVEKIVRIFFHADQMFFHPMEVPLKNQICSAGLEMRDYPTLVKAIEGLDIEVKLAAASPWSVRTNETAGMELPPNVDARRYAYPDLRHLYAESKLVVVPIYQTDFQAGITTILEAMAMGKAVIATRTRGQTDVIRDGIDGIYVEPGDVDGMRAAIVDLLDHPEKTAEIGAAARKRIMDEISLDHLADRIGEIVSRAENSAAHNNSALG